eukprot:scaffold17254_cov99-Isochrysis_galbana.AAC.10
MRCGQGSSIGTGSEAGSAAPAGTVRGTAGPKKERAFAVEAMRRPSPRHPPPDAVGAVRPTACLVYLSLFRSICVFYVKIARRVCSLGPNSTRTVRTDGWGSRSAIDGLSVQLRPTDQRGIPIYSPRNQRGRAQ